MRNMDYPVYPGWNVEREIGRGSFGAVYEISRDVFGKKERAALKRISIPENDSEIKTLQSDGHSKEAITAHFENHLQDVVSEYSVMVDLKSHPNVVYCDDLRYVQHEDGIGWDIFIKMELLIPLKEYVKPYYSESDTVKMGRDLCSALAFCREKNIIHRDIKPENIFVSETGSFKLGDFGIAKVTDKTASGTKIGTFEYMAPEVYNNQPYSFTADVYAVGLVMYWMMNGKRTPFLPQNRIPFAADKENARKKRFGGEKLPAPANGSEKLQEIVLKACAFNPKERYQSAAEMLQALNRMQADEVMDLFANPTVGMWENQPVEKEEKNESVEKTVGVSSNTGDANENADTHVEKEEEQEGTSNLQDGDIIVSGDIQDEPDEIEPESVKPESKEGKKKSIVPIIVGIVAVLVVLLVMFIPKFSGNSADGSAVTKPSGGAAVVENTPTPTPQPTPVHEHQWQEATYNAAQTCTSCGAVVGEKKIPSSSYGLRDIISGVSASSVYSGDNLGTHGPELLYDGKLKTNWTENSTGNGVGEYVYFYFNDTYAINRLSIYNGSHYNEGVYKENCRPKTITLTFSDGSTERISLKDTYDEQIILLKQFYYTDSIKLSIDEVYTGTKYLDAVIAELDFVAYRP